MAPRAYTILFIAVAAGFAALAGTAYRRAGPRALWRAWLVSVALLAAFSVWDWREMPVKETPVVAYVLVTAIPTLGAAAFIQWTARYRQPVLLQFLGAGVICWLLIQWTLLVGMAWGR